MVTDELLCAIKQIPFDKQRTSFLLIAAFSVFLPSFHSSSMHTESHTPSFLEGACVSLSNRSFILQGFRTQYITIATTDICSLAWSQLAERNARISPWILPRNNNSQILRTAGMKRKIPTLLGP